MVFIVSTSLTKEDRNLDVGIMTHHQKATKTTEEQQRPLPDVPRCLEAQSRQDNQRDAADHGAHGGEVVHDSEGVLSFADSRHAQECGGGSTHTKQSNTERPHSLHTTHSSGIAKRGLRGRKQSIWTSHKHNAEERKDRKEYLNP